MDSVLSLLALIQNHWVLIVSVATALSSLVSTLATVLSNHPEAESVLHTIQGLLSFVEHADVGGFKPPLVPLKAPAKPALTEVKK